MLYQELRARLLKGHPARAVSPRMKGAAGMSQREPERMSRRDYLFGMNDIAMYAVSRGSPLLLPSHVAFLVAYVREWLTLEPGQDNEKAVIGALFHRAPRWARHLSVRLHRAQWIPRKIRLPLLLTPLFIPLAVILPCQLVWSAANSAWDILKKGVRNVPPLVTAVVVVFVTSDAWRILGTGFTVRFFILVCAFLTASLLFLIREDWWADVSADEDEATSLLEGMKHWNRSSRSLRLPGLCYARCFLADRRGALRFRHPDNRRAHPDQRERDQEPGRGGLYLPVVSWHYHHETAAFALVQPGRFRGILPGRRAAQRRP